MFKIQDSRFDWHESTKRESINMNGKCMHDRCGLHVGEHSDDIFTMEKVREREREMEMEKGKEKSRGKKSHIFPTSPIECCSSHRYEWKKTSLILSLVSRKRPKGQKKQDRKSASHHHLTIQTASNPLLPSSRQNPRSISSKEVRGKYQTSKQASQKQHQQQPLHHQF
jgi:hypothetical protein